jgi:hypothetical protein
VVDVFSSLFPLVPLSFKIFGDLTPCIPLSSDKERGKILKRGADAPLKHPVLLSALKGKGG